MSERLIPRVLGNTITRFRDAAGLNRYREIYTEEDSSHPLPLKQNYKNGKLIGMTVTAYPWSEDKRLFTDFTPSFAEGPCSVVGGGAYKTAIADQGGRSDKVILLYNWHVYERREEAVAAANKIGAVLDMASQVAPGYVLPFEMKVDEIENGFMVCEIQQRAEPLSIDLFDPKTAEKLEREAEETNFDGTQRLYDRLFNAGISQAQNHLTRSRDDYSFTEICWDLITNHLVSLDVVDDVETGFEQVQ